MKELNEYRNEIFRRSEKKRKQIQTRRRVVLGVGLSLCLCCVITLTVLPKVFSGTKGDFAPSMEAVYDAAENAMSEKPAEFFCVDDAANVAKVLEILEDTNPEHTVDQDGTLADRVETGDYRLILKCSDGSTVCYRVQGREVYCETTGEIFWLSDGKCNSLYTLLLEVANRE